MGSFNDLGWLFDQAASWLTRAVLGALTLLWGFLEQTLFVTPDVTQLPQVRALTSDAQVVVNSGFVLMIVAAGILTMGRESLQVRYGLAEFGPRLVVAFVAANLSAPLCQVMITVANALTTALTGDAITAKGTFGLLRGEVAGALADPAQALLAAVLGVLIAVLVGSLLILWFVRLGLVVVLAGVAPLALACHALPQTNAVARLWWRSMVGTLGTVTAQAVALHAGLSVFLDPKANVRALGIPHDPSGMLNLLMAVCLLWAVASIPKLTRRYVTGGRGAHSVAASLVRVLVVRQLTNVVGRAVRRAPAPHRATGTGGGGTGATGAGHGAISERSGGGAQRPAPVGRRLPAARPPGVRVVRAEPYTPEQLAAGVDLYTRSLRRRRGLSPPSGGSR